LYLVYYFRISGEHPLVSRLRLQSLPSNGDRRHRQYVKYINTFLKPFGNERVYLVGSTGENSKLRWSTDDGDSDFIFVSGRFTIPQENIVTRNNMDSYVWIKTSHLESPKFSFTNQNEYLHHELLKTVSADLFTLLRGIYKTITPINDSTHIRVGTALRSKVGLATEEFENLRFDGFAKEDGHEVEVCPRDPGRSDTLTLYMLERWKNLKKIKSADKKLIYKILTLLSSFRFPGSGGKFEYFATVVKEALDRPPIQNILNKGTCTYSFHKQLYSSAYFLDTPKTTDPNISSKEAVKAYYTKKRNMDFVPALRVQGVLPIMDAYLNRVKGNQWPSQELASKVRDSDVFIIARLAPINADAERDFRLSFNIAEVMLVQNFPKGAHNVFIIMKSYLKGAFRKEFLKRKLKNKLISYHMKTIILWMCEEQNLEFWKESNLVFQLRTVLIFLQTSIKRKRLRHYFVESNLYLDFEDSDVEVMSYVINEILADPLGFIDIFFEMDKDISGEVWLSSDEVMYLHSLKKNGWRGKLVDEVEDAVIDFIRGFNESPRNDADQSPITAAILNSLDMFFEEEAETEYPLKENDLESTEAFQYRIANGFINGAIDVDTMYSMMSNDPTGHLVLKYIGGHDGLRMFQEQANDDINLIRQRLREAVVQFLQNKDDVKPQPTIKLTQQITIYATIKRLFYGKLV